MVQDAQVSDTHSASCEGGTVWAFQKDLVSQTRECKHCPAAVNEKYGVLWSPSLLQREELGWMILVCPFQLRIFCESYGIP